IQLAAVDGSARAQLVLAVMYSEGVGVPVDYARAYHWYETADKQGSPEAKYAMSTFLSLGVEGVADQDKAKAVVYQIDSALSGFKPSA
ncbi:tetratricopeptide repeat protein, partial [Klebsiella aerogenes]|uniref:tetratricopeptide repeat protein n=1 Tax=Klebsiella aerogenes TaxID=548 RepID=UPI0013D0A2D4